MVPPPKIKRSPVEVNYLENMRMVKGETLERDQQNYKPKNWKKELK